MRRIRGRSTRRDVAQKPIKKEEEDKRTGTISKASVAMTPRAWERRPASAKRKARLSETFDVLHSSRVTNQQRVVRGAEPQATDWSLIHPFNAQETTTDAVGIPHECQRKLVALKEAKVSVQAGERCQMV